jgi:DNA polymerase III delta prime subunit
MASIVSLAAGEVAALEGRSRETCVVYTNQRLPRGCHPATGDLGIEGSGRDTLLHLRQGVRYDGDDDGIRDWIASGTRTFPSFGSCMAWLREHVDVQQQAQAGHLGAAEPNFVRLPPEEVTELDDVHFDAQVTLSKEDLEAKLAQQVLGQPIAIRDLAKLTAHHVAKPNPRRPASALLIGPTGSGKTLAAEQLAHNLSATTGAQWSYQRLDMNEFSERHTQSRLFGAPPGYIGYGDGHDLASALRNNPRTVVLFDEIDKADPQVWRSLMNLMDAGRLSGQAGDIDARHCILLFTSNKDAEAIQSIADAPDRRRRAFLRDHGYPPEVVGRLTRILVFMPLATAAKARIVVVTCQRIVESYGFQLDHISPESVASLAMRAPFDAGGRDVEYFIERELEDQLAARVGMGHRVCIDGTEQFELLDGDSESPE